MAKIHLIYFDIDTGYYPGVNHGVASLAAVARKGGHFFSFQHLTSLKPLEKVADLASRDDPDIVAFSFTTNQAQHVQRYSEAIGRKLRAIQIAGGIHPTVDPESVLKIKAIQGICVGEGESSLQELLNRIDKGESFYNLASFWWKAKDGGLIKNPISPLEKDLSSLPFPDYSVFDAKNICMASAGWVAMLLIRGCPHNCYYCCNHVLKKIYLNDRHYVRIPTVKYAIDLIKNNLGFYDNPSGINFADDLLVFNQKWFNEFAQEYKREIGLPFTCNSRPEYLSDKMIHMLKESGCRTLFIGVESGNEWVRENILGRHYSNKRLVDTFKRVKKAGISAFSYNIVGLPFETKEQMRETLNINKAIKPDMGAVFYFYPYPGTRLFDICKEYNLLLEEKKMMNFSGYFEEPAIRLTHCKLRDCAKAYSRLKLFLITRTFIKSLKLPPFFGGIIYRFMNINSSFWVNLATRNSRFKHIIRRFFYKKFFS